MKYRPFALFLCLNIYWYPTQAQLLQSKGDAVKGEMRSWVLRRRNAVEEGEEVEAAADR